MMSTIKGRFSLLALLVGFAVAFPGGLASKDRLLEIERKVDSAMAYMLQEIPDTEALVNNAKGILVIPVVTKAGVLVGGSYGEGALRIGEKTLEYYVATQASYGLQFGFQQYSQVLFFMTESAMNDFLISDGFKVGVNAEVSLFNDGDYVGLDSLSSKTDIIGVVFGQQGALFGASIEGTVYDELH